jgi:ureidoglycolate lyase
MSGLQQVRKLEVVQATRESLRGMGELVSFEDGDVSLDTAFYEGSVRVFSPCHFISDSDTELTVARIDRRPCKVQWMERHFKHTQTFIPLQGRPFIAVLAPASESELPDLDNVRAFLFDGSAGFLLNIGTWHEFPFAITDDTRVVVILRSEATKNLLTHAVSDGEAHGPDLDKKDLKRRLSVEFEFAL